MKHRSVTAASLPAGLNPFARLSPLAELAVWLVGATIGLSASARPARAAEVPFVEHVILTSADLANSVSQRTLTATGTPTFSLNQEVTRGSRGTKTTAARP